MRYTPKSLEEHLLDREGKKTKINLSESSYGALFSGPVKSEFSDPTPVEENAVPSPAQFVYIWSTATDEKRYRWAVRILENDNTARECFVRGHQNNVEYYKNQAEVAQFERTVAREELVETRGWLEAARDDAIYLKEEIDRLLKEKYERD